MNAQIIVIAKAPVPGRVKTRLCPPCTPEEAARIAAAALDDTLDAVDATDTARRTLVLAGEHPLRAGWAGVPQRGDGFDARLVHAFADTALAGHGTLLIGMDTPQLDAGLLDFAAGALGEDEYDAALGLAEDGGWWALALRDPADAQVLHGVPMSTPRTGARTLAALRERGLRVHLLPTLRDVDCAADARAVAALAPAGRFAAAVHAALPAAAGR